jgi:glucosamine 6-phosphate synthetase-like amidotransferase/phosphosugar isomerase protein
LISENNSFIKIKKIKKKRGNFSSNKVTLEVANMDDSAHRSSTSNKFKLGFPRFMYKKIIEKRKELSRTIKKK